MTMTEDKVLYTDGHDVVITPTTFHVKNREYRLNGITSLGFLTLQPDRAPGLILFLLGAAISIFGILNAIPKAWMNTIEAGGYAITINNLATWGGLLLAIIGALLMGLVRERYAVRIVTAEGEKNAVVSEKREYITQIVEALNRAYIFMGGKPESKISPSY